MGVNKIVYDSKVLLDLTEDTVTPEDLVNGIIAHDRSGQKITGNIAEAKKFQCVSFKLGEETSDSGTKYINLTPRSGYPHFSPNADSNVDLSKCYIAKAADLTYDLQTNASGFGNATAADVSAGKTFTSAAGLKVVGTKNETAYDTVTSIKSNLASHVSGSDRVENNNGSSTTIKTVNIKNTVTTDNTKFYRNTTSIDKGLIDHDSNLNIEVVSDASNFGNATSAEVAYGKTFTSAAGVRVNGSLKNITEVTGGGSDANLSTSNRYVNGVSQKCIDITSNSGSLNLSTTSISTGIVKDKSKLKVIGTAPCTSFGDATAADVASGKTFTSAAGLKVKGTNTGNGTFNTQSKTITPKATDQTVYPDSGYNGLSSVTVKGDSNLKASNIKSGVRIFGITGSYSGSGSGGSSNNNVEAYLVNATNPAVSFKTTTGTIKVYGYATASTTSQWGGNRTTQYSFDGDGYYTSISYGTPTKTHCTFGVSNGKLTGLPTLNGGTLLVVRGL